MNERIKALALQAGYKPLSPSTFGDELNEIFMERFAQLIVRECVKAAEEAQADYYIVTNIKHRLGVES